MQSDITVIRPSIGLCIALCFWFICQDTSSSFAQNEAPQAIALVGSSELPVERLGRAEFINLISGYTRRINNSPNIRIVIVNGDPTYEHLTREYLNKSHDQFINHWRRLVFTGRGIMPAIFDSKEDALDFLSETPNALGLFSSDSLPQNAKSISVDP